MFSPHLRVSYIRIAVLFGYLSNNQLTMGLYKDTLPRKEGFERLFDFTRQSQIRYQSKIYLDGTFEIEEALSKPEIHFWLQVNDDLDGASLELFEMTRLSVRRSHRNPRCVISVMVMGKVENLARMSTENLQEFVGNNSVIVVFENVELFMTRMRLRKMKKGEGYNVRTLFPNIKKEDGCDFPIDWPVEKRLWDLRVRENAVEEFALKNEPVEHLVTNANQEDNANDNNNSVMNENQNNAVRSDPWVRENFEFLVQEEFSDTYGYSRWVPVQDLLTLHDVRLSGRMSNLRSPSNVVYPVPRPTREVRVSSVQGHGKAANIKPKKIVFDKDDSKSCPWCPLAVGSLCASHSQCN